MGDHGVGGCYSPGEDSMDRASIGTPPPYVKPRGAVG